MTDWINWKEIEETPSLKLIAYFLIFNLALFLNKAYTLLGTSIFHPICHPFFQNCFKWQTFFFLNFAPAMRPVFLTVMFSLLCFATYSLIKNKFLNFYYCILGFFVFFLLPWFAVTYHQELFTYP